jgi:hypothetical protein
MLACILLAQILAQGTKLPCRDNALGAGAAVGTLDRCQPYMGLHRSESCICRIDTTVDEPVPGSQQCCTTNITTCPLYENDGIHCCATVDTCGTPPTPPPTPIDNGIDPMAILEAVGMFIGILPALCCICFCASADRRAHCMEECLRGGQKKQVVEVKFNPNAPVLLVSAEEAAVEMKTITGSKEWITATNAAAAREKRERESHLPANMKVAKKVGCNGESR